MKSKVFRLVNTELSVDAINAAEKADWIEPIKDDEDLQKRVREGWIEPDGKDLLFVWYELD